jgi:ribonuclease VapC
MIVDSSAIIAIAQDEPDAEHLFRTLYDQPSPRISAGNLLETYVVIDQRWGEQAPAVIERVLLPLGLIVEPVTGAQVEIARDAYRRYGKGSKHPARLNYGDCFAYALARERGEPLLFVGNDFAHTDISPAL